MFQLSGGQFLYGNGAPIANGTLELTLSTSANIIATSAPAPNTYSFSLDANGVITGSAPVYGNAELTPAGTYYIAVVLDSFGHVVWGPINWAVGPAALYSGSLYPNVLVLPPFSGGGGGGVVSVFGRSPVVLAQAGDYNDSQVTPHQVTQSFSATPAFNALNGSKFKMTLTGNVASSTLVNATAGQLLVFIIVQDGTGGRSFVWPANFKGAMPVSTSASAVSVQAFIYDGTNAYAVGPGTIN